MRTATGVLLAAILTVGANTVAAWGADGTGNQIKAGVVDLHNGTGDVDCSLFSSADGFPSEFAKAAKSVKVKIDNQKAQCIFSDVAPGDYAISVMHDENSDGKLDRNFLGIPKEGVGASNDAAGSFGPPKFQDARFSYPGGTAVMTIHMKYLVAPL